MKIPFFGFLGNGTVKYEDSPVSRTIAFEKQTNKQTNKQTTKQQNHKIIGHSGISGRESVDLETLKPVTIKRGYEKHTGPISSPNSSPSSPIS